MARRRRAPGNRPGQRDLAAEAERRFVARVLPERIAETRQGGRVIYARAEVELYEQTVEGLLLQGAGNHQLLRAMREQHGLGQAYALKLAGRVRRRWADETEQQRPFTRAEQIRRVRRMILRLQGDPIVENNQVVGWRTPPDYQKLLRWERFLADLEGNREPIRVDIDVRYTQAMLAVIGSVDGEHLKRLADEQREVELKAKAFDALPVPSAAE